MFHTYVMAYTKRMVDIDRASFLIDKTLLYQAREAMKKERDECPRWDATYGPQWVWEHYCARHEEKYGAPFEPNIESTWDQ